MGELHSRSTATNLPGSRFPTFYLGTIGWYVPNPTATAPIEAIGKLYGVPEMLTTLLSEPIVPDTVEGVGCIKCTALRKERPSSNELVERYLARHGLRLYVIRPPHNKWPTGEVLFDCHNRHPTQVVTGVWLPSEAKIIAYSTGAHGLSDGTNAHERNQQAAPQVRHITTLHLVSVHVNDVKDSTFTIAFPPNTSVANYLETERQGRPLASPIDNFADQRGRLVDRPMKTMHPDTNTSIRRILVIGNCVSSHSINSRAAYKRAP